MSKKKKTKSVQSRAVDINQLPQAKLIDVNTLENPQSRAEMYLHYINNTGRIAFNQLPNPQSRIEYLLMYLCEQIHLGNIGGGGGQPFNGVTSVTYDAQNKQLVVITNGIESRLSLANLSDVTDVQYDQNTHIITVDRNGNQLEIDLKETSTKINRIAPVDGNIDLGLNKVGDRVSLTVAGRDVANVDLTDYVKTVNNQPNQGGNVTVKAEHMEYNNVTSQVTANTVQGAIDELKRDMALLDNSDIFIVNDLADYNNKVNTFNLKTGDLIYFLRSDNVVDYAGTDVNNGGNPVAMIYDNNTTGNKLRVFSKLDTPITINANNVKYDDIQSNLGATNVQDAIKKLNEKFVSDIEFEVATRTLKKTINNVQTSVVSGIVTKWQDLEYTKEYTDINILDYSKVVNNKAIDTGGEYVDDNTGNWGIVEFPVTENQQYTLVRKRNFPLKIRFENENKNKVDFISVNSNIPVHGGWHRYTFNAPQGAKKAILEVKVSQDNEKETMIFEGDKTNLPIDVNNPIPFLDGGLIQVGSEVSLGFNNSNTSLTSTTVSSAIKELNEKIANAGGGTVSSINGISPNGGNVALTARVTQDIGRDILLQVGNLDFATLECMTEVEADAIIDGFIL